LHQGRADDGNLTDWHKHLHNKDSNSPQNKRCSYKCWTFRESQNNI